MSRFSARVREAVAARAGARCEYCQLPARGQVATFPVDHIAPESRGGSIELSNLALACPHCNAHKWNHQSAIDPATGESVPLFNPRTQPWSQHFSWSVQAPFVLTGLTSVGRATIACLQMNAETMQTVRRLLQELGLRPSET